MSLLIKAKMERKKWVSWVGQNLRSPLIMDEADSLSYHGRLLKMRTQEGATVSYGFDGLSSTDEVVDQLISSFHLLEIDKVAVVVNGKLAPLILIVNFPDLDLLLREFARRDELVTVGTVSADGSIVVDVPYDSISSDAQISSEGSMKKIIDDFEQAIPGGTRF